MKEKSSYDHTPCEGCYLNHIRVYNTKTGQKVQPKCKSYKCEKHGWMQSEKLKEAIERRVKSWEKVRFWTFTLSSKYFKNEKEHSKALSHSWRYFVTELRRNKILNEKQRAVQYIRVSEPHKSGYFHFHVFFSQYIHFNSIRSIWEWATRTATKLEGKLGSVDVRGNINAKATAKYVAKYVVKTANNLIKGQNLYSCSGNEALFEKVEKTESYAVYHVKLDKWVGLRGMRPCLDINTKLHHKSSQEILLEMSLSEKMGAP